LRFLVDENLPADIARQLTQREHDVVYVPHSNLRSSPDDALWRLAAEEGRIIITKDLRLPLTERPAPAGIVLLRVPPQWGRGEIAGLFSDVLDRIEIEGTGKIVVVTPRRIRVRTFRHA
jgi:predicted nuclease of predicted toxin-antitoxin system